MVKILYLIDEIIYFSSKFISSKFDFLSLPLFSIFKFDELFTRAISQSDAFSLAKVSTVPPKTHCEIGLDNRPCNMIP